MIDAFMGYTWKVEGCQLRWKLDPKSDPAGVADYDPLDVFEFEHQIIALYPNAGRLIVETYYGRYCVNMGYYEQNIYPMVTLMEKF